MMIIVVRISANHDGGDCGGEDDDYNDDYLISYLFLIHSIGERVIGLKLIRKYTNKKNCTDQNLDIKEKLA